MFKIVKQSIRWIPQEPHITNKRANAYLSFATILLIVFIYLAYAQFLWIENTYAIILSVVTIALRIVLYGLKNVDEEYRIPSIIMYIIAFISLSSLTLIIYEYDLFQVLGWVENSYDSVKISFWLVISLIIAIPIVQLLKKDFRDELIGDFSDLRNFKPPKSFYIIIGGLVAYIATVIVFWSINRSSETFNYAVFFMWVIASMVVILIFVVWILPRSQAELNKLSLDMDQLPTFILEIVIAIVLIVLVPYITQMATGIQDYEDSLGSLFSARLFSSDMILIPSASVIGQSGGTPNYFSWVLFILLQDRVPALMISFMVFGAVSAMLIQNMGGVARIISGFALSITVIIPLLFIVTIITGGIPPPIELERILGFGTAALVYALAQTSAFILMLAIIGVFVAGGQFLGGVMGRDD